MQRIVHLSDTHIPATENEDLLGFFPYESLKLILQEIAELDPQPEAIIVTGDMVASGAESEYTLFKTLLSQLKIPVYWLPGNHDDSSEMQKAADGEQFSNKRTVTLDAWHVVMLNSQVIGSDHGHLNAEELVFLSDELNNNLDKPTLVALHHTPCAPCVNANCQLDNRDELLALLKSHTQVKLVLAGHTHYAEKVNVDRLDVFTGPSAFSQVVHTDDKTLLDPEDFFASHQLDGSNVGFGVFDLSPDGGYLQKLHLIDMRDQTV